MAWIIYRLLVKIRQLQQLFSYFSNDSLGSFLTLVPSPNPTLAIASSLDLSVEHIKVRGWYEEAALLFCLPAGPLACLPSCLLSPPACMPHRPLFFPASFPEFFRSKTFFQHSALVCRLMAVWSCSDQWEGRGCRRSRNHYMLVGEMVLVVFFVILMGYHLVWTVIYCSASKVKKNSICSK